MDGNDRALTAFTMLGHAMFHTYEFVVPLFVVVWLDAFTTSTVVVGVVVGASYAMTGLGAVPSGLLADRVSARWLITVSMAGMGGGFLILSVAPTVPVLSLGLLLWGCAASLYHPAGLSLISRGAKERGTAFAYHGVAGNLGVATGPVLATVLFAYVGWRLVAALLVVPVGLAIVIGTRLEFDETAASDIGALEGADRQGAVGGRRVFSESMRLFASSFALVFGIGCVYGLYYRGAFTFLPEVLAGLSVFDPIRVAGRTLQPGQYLYAGLLVLGGAGQYAGGKLVDSYRPERVLVANFGMLVIVAMAFVPAANTGRVPLLVVSGLLGFFVFLEAPVNQEVISRHVPGEVRGLSFGWTYVGVFGVGAAGSAIAGLVLAEHSPSALFAVLACVALVALLAGVVLLHSEVSRR